MREIICGIYKITNKINGKVYIGQSKDIYKRWNEHRKECRKKKKNIALYCALAKYGCDNFSYDILERCDESELDDLEIKYIKQYRSYIGFEDGWGYNMTLGGQLCHTYVGNSDQGVYTYQYDLKGNFVAKYRSRKEACQALGLKGTASITRAIKDCGSAGGFQWRNEYYEKINPFVKPKRTVKVYQYSNKGGFIQEFESIQKAAEYVNCNRSLIEQCCEKYIKTAKNFQWSYIKVKNIGSVAPMKQPSKWLKVYQYSKDGTFMQSFPCAKIASELTGVSLRAIQHNLCGESKTAYGYIFKYIDEGGENVCKKT